MPFSLEAEQAVLGSILIDPTCITNIIEYVRAEFFYIPQHQEIFSAMLSIAISEEVGQINPDKISAFPKS